MSKVYKSVTELIGKTPLVELTNIEKEFDLKVKLLAKVEFLNPTGSVKDRAALELIVDAENKGLINENSVIIEPTSGNTGIGLAAVAVAKGYKAIIVMPDSMSPERIKLMSAYGAEVVLTDGKKGMTGAIEKAQELANEISDSFIPDQFNNPANAKAHFNTTGPEIFDDTDGVIDVFVAGIGTGGTITGTGEYLKSKNNNIKIIGVEPDKSPVLTKGVSGPHGIQGIGAGFVPKVLDLNVVDEVVAVSDEDAYKFARILGKKEGLLVGISSGAALKAATEKAKLPENEGKTIVVLLPDSGSRYMSTQLF
ncbi:MAG: cysteine synthase A [Ruminococcaceae bacterium]|nr:cysteine synthase A [Oscillospiraceae bacterium]